jgi:N6-adenosine-specific RNA methylase IME4
MSHHELCGYLASTGVSIDRDAVLLLWRLASMQGDALELARAWGFRPLSEVVWIKTTKTGKPWFGMGRTVRASHETCLVCVRGRASRVVQARNVRSVFSAPVPVGADGRYVHSAKPEAFFGLVAEPLAPGPRLELFARRRRAGWDQLGNQLERSAA